MEEATSMPFDLVDIAGIVGGFSTLFAAMLATVVVPVAYFEARRQKKIAQEERIAQVIDTYIGRREQFYDESYVVNRKLDDIIEDTFQNYYHVPQIDNMVSIIEFCVKRLSEIDVCWKSGNSSIVALFDKDTRQLDGYVTVEVVSSMVCDNACEVALSEADLAGVDAAKNYEWEDPFEYEGTGRYPTRALDHPLMDEEEWPDYRASEAYNVRFKRQLLSGMYSRRQRRNELRAEVRRLDQIRSSLSLEPLFRHPSDMMEEADA